MIKKLLSKFKCRMCGKFTFKFCEIKVKDDIEDLVGYPLKLCENCYYLIKKED